MENKGDNSKPDPNGKMDMFKPFTDPPQWMDKNYVESVLQGCEKDSLLKLLNYKIVSATKPGDNFASIALRLRATFLTKGEEKTIKFIVKVEPYEQGFKKDVLSDTVLFASEISMYTQTIPVMQRLITAVDPDEVIAPHLAYYSLDPYKIVFIEDISPEFTMSEQHLDFKTSVKVFEKIAKFHAISMYMHDQREPLEKYTEGFVSKQLAGTAGFIVQGLDSFADVIQGWGGEMEIAAKKLKSLVPNMYERLMKLFAVNKNGLNVLNHGDFHIKNLLFRQQNSELKQVDPIRLIDFQLCIWATPAIDLIFALYGMVDHTARDRREELIRCYHNQLKRTLEQLGYLQRIPTMLDIQVELLRNGLIEVFLVTFLMPMMYTDKSKLIALGEVTFEKMEELRKSTLESSPFKDALLKVLPGFLNKGFLDD